jgi:hypothetical protein
VSGFAQLQSQQHLFDGDNGVCKNYSEMLNSDVYGDEASNIADLLMNKRVLATANLLLRRHKERRCQR